MPPHSSRAEARKTALYTISKVLANVPQFSPAALLPPQPAGYVPEVGGNRGDEKTAFPESNSCVTHAPYRLSTCTLPGELAPLLPSAQPCRLIREIQTPPPGHLAHKPNVTHGPQANVPVLANSPPTIGRFQNRGARHTLAFPSLRARKRDDVIVGSALSFDYRQSIV